MPKQKETLCTSLEDKLLDYDSYGEGFNFTLPNGKEKYGTWFGFIFTVAINGLILIYGYNKGMKLFGYGDTTIL